MSKTKHDDVLISDGTTGFPLSEVKETRLPGGSAEEQDHGGSERTQCRSAQGPGPPAAVGTSLRRLTAVRSLVHLRGAGGEGDRYTQTNQEGGEGTSCPIAPSNHDSLNLSLKLPATNSQKSVSSEKGFEF